MSTDEPTIEELVGKALASETIDDEFAGELRGCTTFGEALEAFYNRLTQEGQDPEPLLSEWNIIVDE
jgi:hypothetical protein